MPGDDGRDVRQNRRGLTSRVGLHICSIGRPQRPGHTRLHLQTPFCSGEPSRKPASAGEPAIRSILLGSSRIQVNSGGRAPISICRVSFNPAGFGLP
jgi:hypothetical protein